MGEGGRKGRPSEMEEREGKMRKKGMHGEEKNKGEGCTLCHLYLYLGIMI